MHGVIDTDKGAIEIEFFEADAPRAVENFRLLAEHGYYDGLTFHRTDHRHVERIAETCSTIVSQGD